MDETQIVTATLNNTIQRFSKMVHNYEVEVANLTAEVVRLKSALDEANSMGSLFDDLDASES